MKLNEYQSKAMSTAIYPPMYRLAYPALGLAGEIFEFLEKASGPQFNRQGCLDELGDVLWYIAVIANDAKLTLSVCAGRETFEEILHHYPDRKELMRHARRVVETVKKAIRDDYAIVVEEKQCKIKNGLRAMLPILQGFAHNFGGNLADIAANNLAKLQDRKERGKLQGSGDNR